MFALTCRLTCADFAWQAMRTSSHVTSAMTRLFRRRVAGSARCVCALSCNPLRRTDPAQPLQFCKTRQAIPFQPKYDTEFSEKQVRFVLGVCGVRDDPRFLARLAFGVSSPRITQLGLSRHDIFGCCETADFNKLLERFEAECKEQGYRNRTVLAPPKQSARNNEGETDGKGASAPKKAPAKRTASGGAKAGGAAKKFKK